MADRIIFRHDTSANWQRVNPVLMQGEIGLEDDTKLKKLGDGVNAWNDLDYIATENVIDSLGSSKTAAISQNAVNKAINTINTNIGLDEYEEFSEAKAYSAGSTIKYNGLLYTFTTDHAAGAWDAEEVEDSSLKNQMATIEANLLNKIEMPMPFCLLPYGMNDDMIQIDYMAKKIKVAADASYFIIRNKMPYTAVVSNDATGAIGEYETDFIYKESSSINQQQIWLLAFNNDDKKLYYIHYAAIPNQYDSYGRIQWYPLAYCIAVNGQLHTNFNGTLYYNGVRYSNISKCNSSNNGWQMCSMSEPMTLLDDQLTLQLPSHICMFNIIQRQTIVIYFDKSADDTWTNTYNKRHYVSTARSIQMARNTDVISALYFVPSFGINDDYMTVPFITRQYNDSYTNILPSINAYGDYTLIGTYRRKRFTTCINVLQNQQKQKLNEPMSVSFYGTDNAKTIVIDTVAGTVSCKSGNQIFLTKSDGTFERAIFNDSAVTSIIFKTSYSSYVLYYLLYCTDTYKVYFVEYIKMGEFITEHGLSNIYVLAAGVFNNNCFTTHAPFVLNGQQYLPVYPVIEEPTKPTESINACTQFANSYIGNLDYQNIGDTDYSHIILYGQSLSQGFQAPRVITTEAVEGNYMVGNAPYYGYNNNNATQLNPLIAVKYSNIGEEPIVSLTNAFSNLYRRFANKRQLFIGSNPSQDGRSIEKLSKECTNGTTQENNLYMQRFYKLLTDTKSIVDGEDKTVSCSAILYMQGEYNYTNLVGNGLTDGTNATNDKDTYKQLLLTLKNNMQNDVMSVYGQSKKPLFFIYQVAGSYINNKEMSINMAQIEFAMENDDVFLLNPTYFTPDYSGGHLSTNGYRWYGEQMGKALYNVFINGVDCMPIFPMNFIKGLNYIDIDMYVPVLPLVFDTSIKENITNYGFKILDDDTEVTISDIELYNNRVRLNCNKNFKGVVEITYAGQGRSGSGNLRDSDAFHSMYKYFDDSDDILKENYTPQDMDGNKIYGKNYPMYNWLVNFYHKFN